MCTIAISVRDMATQFTCRVMGFRFSEMAKVAAKKLSTGSQRFSNSQQQPQSQKSLNQKDRRMELPTKMSKKALAKQRWKQQLQMTKDAENKLSTSSQLSISSQQQSQSQKPPTQQDRERMELPTKISKKALAKQRRKEQLQRSQSESVVKMGSEFGEVLQSQKSDSESEVEMSSEFQGFSKMPRPLFMKDIMRILNDDSDKTNSEGQIKLSEQQLTVLRAVSRGNSVFLTGSAGTGKSYLLDYVVKILKELHGPGSVFVTASTGIAACHLNGMTLHSFSGAPIWATNNFQMLEAVKKNKRSVKRWKKAKALIIDEISMIDGVFFDQLNYVANQLREGISGGLQFVKQPLERKRVWGGLQLVVTGDFFQLPPVKPQDPNKSFAFEADCWNDCFNKQIELTHVFRQSDRELVDMLQEIRKGLCNPTTLAKLNNYCHPSVTSGGVVTRLYPLNVDVRRVNEERLEALKQEIITFSAMDTGEEYEMNKLNSGIAPEQIGLCVGAQVMLIKNLGTDKRLVNGATGQIVEFLRDDKHPRDISPGGLWPKVRFLCGVERIIKPESWSIHHGEKVVAKRTQVPLILAWAITVHKCQGMTLERLETDLIRAFGYGMVYVALSRIKNLDGLRLIGFQSSKIKAHPKVLDFDQKLTNSSTPL